MAMRSPRVRMRVRVRRPRMRRRLPHLSVNRMVPNVLTLLALCLEARRDAGAIGKDRVLDRLNLFVAIVGVRLRAAGLDRCFSVGDRLDDLLERRLLGDGVGHQSCAPL